MKLINKNNEYYLRHCAHNKFENQEKMNDNIQGKAKPVQNKQTPAGSKRTGRP